jgi:hypothetical protein
MANCLKMPMMFKSPQPSEFFPNEVFADIPLLELPEGFNHHKASNYGRIYDCRAERFCHQRFDTKGYYYIDSAYNGKHKLARVHRLVLSAFNYSPECKELIVNHIDGIKYHNYLWNLEWTTQSGNIQHAYRLGLNRAAKGEDNHNALITNEQAIQICELIQSGLSTKEIHDITGIDGEIIKGIKCRHTWRFISDNYVFPEPRKTVEFPEDMIHAMCRLFELYPMTDESSYNDYYRKIMNMCGMEITSSNLEKARTLHKRIRHTDISKDYNF